MRAYDAIIVGGGPGGSSCAWALTRAGRHALVVDKARFPRDKVCAGWITPAVLTSLEIDTREYASQRTLQPITGFRTGRLGEGRLDAIVDTRFDQPVSYGIRRCEFDHYLLERSGADLVSGHPVRHLRREGRDWVVDEIARAPFVVGAGGHFCPVARFLNGPRRAEPVVAAREIEVPIDGTETEQGVDGETPELYFCDDFRGYGWAFRKGSYLNVGFGRQDSARLPERARAFSEVFRAGHALPSALEASWRGHAYLLCGSSPRTAVGDGILLVGDAAGLAYPQSGEGIRPAVEAGLMASRAIVAASEGSTSAPLAAYAQWIAARGGGERWRRVLERVVPAGVAATAGGWMLAVPWFARHVLLERWFLHAHEPVLDPVTELSMRIA